MAAQRDARTDKTEKLTLAQAVNHGLAEEMERDPNILVMGEDVGVDGGVFRVTEGLMEKFGPDRVMDTPLAESAIVGAAIGLAVAGFRPVCEIQFTGFVYPALNQLFAHVARYRNRSRGRYPLPMVIRMPYGGGIHPPEHHSESYEALFAHTPGLKVVIPSTPSDAKGLITAAIRDDDPVIFMEPKRIYRAFREDVSSLEYTVPIGEAKIVSEGKDVTIIAYGAMVRVALEAQEALARQNVAAEVIDLRTINPMDIKTVLGSAEKTGRVVVVHEAPRNMGVGAEIAALVQERAMLSLLAPIQRVCGFDSVFPFPRLEEHYLPTKERVMEAVQKTLDF